MLRRQRQIRAWVQRLLDGTLFGLALWLAHVVRDTSGIEVFGGTARIESFSHYVYLLFLVVAFSPLVLELQGYYDRPILASRRQTGWILFKACLVNVALIIGAMFLFKILLSRAVVMLFGPISFLLIMIKEEVMRRSLQSSIGQSQFKRRLIVAGSQEDIDRFLPAMRGISFDGLEIVAHVDLNKQSIEDFVDLLHEHSVNAVVLSARHTFFGQVEKAIQACELEGIEAWLVADFFNTQVSQASWDEFRGRPVLVFRSTPDESWQRVAKQALDFVGSAVLLALSSPIFAALALAIRFTSPGPVFFRQQRAGLNGRAFTMLKFRSMVTDAEQRKHELERLNEMSGPVFKVTNDPRITPLGRFMRKWSLDELPQLINVLRGEMSLVGPRPLPLDEVKRFDDLAHRRRLSVKPGLTCLWQVNGRNTITDFKEWVRLDLEYIDNWTFWLDIRILIQTIPIVLRGTGAK